MFHGLTNNPVLHAHGPLPLSG